MNVLHVSILSAIVLLVIDLIWILINKNKYLNMYAKVTKQRTEMNSAYGLIAYIIMTLSVFLFVVPGMHMSVIIHKEPLIWASIKHGLLFGFVIYGVYNFTNLATLGSSWNLGIAITDLVWGSSLYFIVALMAGYLIKK